MQTIVLLLPALAALCQGAAVPQVLVTGSGLPVPRPTSYTFVIPCVPGIDGCVPRTVTLYGRDEEAARTVAPRQVLGDPTRTVIVAPTPTWSFPGWPWWPTVTVTVTQTAYITPTDNSGGATRTVPPLTVPLDKREPQVLGDPTRTVIGGPTPPPWWFPWPTKPNPPTYSATRWPSPDPEPITRTTAPLTVPIEEREPQVLGDPTRTVPVWPSTPTPESSSKTHHHSTSKKPWLGTTKHSSTTVSIPKPTTTSDWDDVEKRQEWGFPGGSDSLTIPTASVTFWSAGDSSPTLVLEPPL